jgi:cystathionine beta-lyase/cystathionine gamma-synthase
MGSDGWPGAPAAGEATNWGLGENTRAVHLPPAPVPGLQPFAGVSWDHPAAEAFATAAAAMEGGRLPQPTMAQAFASGMAAGIDPGAVRFSIGLEYGEDLIADAHLALDSLGTG